MITAKLKWLVIFLILLACSPWFRISERRESTFEPFSILSVESYLVEIKYAPPLPTRSNQRHYSKKVDSYIYDLVFKLSFHENIETWDSPIYVHLEYPGHDELLKGYDKELTRVSDDIFPEFVAQLEVKKRGTIIAALGYKDVSGEILFDQTNPFRSARVELK